MIQELDAIIRESLMTLAADISMPNWTGRREREIVSLFVLGHLLGHCRLGAFLHDSAQISIEVAVPQVTGQIALTGRPTAKDQVCKDVVIWPEPKMTCWDRSGRPTVRPSCVVEWKHDEGDSWDYDVRWLSEFSAGAADFVGYAVCTNLKAGRGARLSCTRVYQARSEAKWLVVS